MEPAHRFSSTADTIAQLPPEQLPNSAALQPADLEEDERLFWELEYAELGGEG